MLHLGAGERVLDAQRRDAVLAVKQAMLALDIVELNGEAVGGSDQFLLGKQQRGGTALLAPPAEDFPSSGEFPGGDFAQYAEDVEVGEVGLVVSGNGRTVEDDGDEALAVSLLQFSNELRE